MRSNLPKSKLCSSLMFR